RDAPARLVPAPAARGQARSGALGAVRRARRDHPAGDARLALTRARGRAADRCPHHARRRGGRDARRPSGGDVATAGPRRLRDRRNAPPAPSSDGRGHCRVARARAGGAGSRYMRRALRVAPAVILVLVLIGIWELYVDLKGSIFSQAILPAPHQVASSLYDDRSLLWSSFLVTAQEVLLGILAAVVIGAVLSIAIHFSPTLRRATYPLIVASQAVPVAVFAPILAFWLGFGILPKLLGVAVLSFFSIVVTTTAGLDAVDPDLIKVMRTFDASRLTTFRHVELPSALPAVFAGAKIAVAVSVIGAVFAEYTGSNSGLGYVILVSQPQLLAARTVAAVVVLSLFAIGLFALLALAQRLPLPRADRPAGGR